MVWSTTHFLYYFLLGSAARNFVRRSDGNAAGIASRLRVPSKDAGYNKSCILIFILLYRKSMATWIPKARIQIGYDTVLHH